MKLKKVIGDIKTSKKSSSDIEKIVEDSFKFKEKLEPAPKKAKKVKVKNNKPFKEEVIGLSKAVKIPVISIGVLGIVSAITFPILSKTVLNKSHVDPTPTPSETFKLSETSINLVECVPHTLVASGVPEGTTVKWHSTNPKVATVDENGTLLAPLPSSESTTIIATAGNKLATCVVNGVDLDVIDFATCSWADINSKCERYKSGIYTDEQFAKSFTYDSEPLTSLDDFIGKEREVKLINPDGTEQENAHKVRVIGVNHDDYKAEDESIKKSTLTFEFANLISDNDGNSIAIFLQDNSENTKINNDYINSSGRKALCGSGSFATTVLFSQKGQSDFSATYDDKTILSMLPEDLKSVLKNTQKHVGIAANSANATYTDTTYEDKLFVLSLKELGGSEGYDGGYGTVYSYYSDSKTATSRRIKCQLNSTVCASSTNIPSGGRQQKSGSVENYAGYNIYDEDTSKYGGYYWTRSPHTNEQHKAWTIKPDGSINAQGYITGYVYGVAPAFCI